MFVMKNFIDSFFDTNKDKERDQNRLFYPRPEVVNIKPEVVSEMSPSIEGATEYMHIA